MICSGVIHGAACVSELLSDKILHHPASHNPQDLQQFRYPNCAGLPPSAVAVLLQMYFTDKTGLQIEHSADKP